MGMATYSCFVFWLHTTFWGTLRDWNKILVTFIFVVLTFYPITVLIAGGFPEASDLRYHAFEIIRLPLFWLSILPAVAVMAIPFYLERLYWQLFSYPEFL